MDNILKTFICKIETTEDGDRKTIKGVASKMGVIDHDGDIIASGAFNKSIHDRGPESNANAKIPLATDHDLRTGAVIGKITRLEEIGDELIIEAVLAKTQKADEIHDQIKLGLINQMSVGFGIIANETEEIDTGRLFKRVKLFEISIVTFGANENTRLNAKSMLLKGLDLSGKQLNRLNTVTNSMAILLRKELSGGEFDSTDIENIIKRYLTAITGTSTSAKTVAPAKSIDLSNADFKLFTD